MKIQEQDFYHGVVLTQIVEHGSFKALNKTHKKYGHYTVNSDRNLFVKYRTTAGHEWRFTFQPDELRAIRLAMGERGHTFLCLVCGYSTICCLDEEEIDHLIDVSSRLQQWISVQVPPGGSQHVTGRQGDLGYTIPHNSFPEKILT